MNHNPNSHQSNGLNIQFNIAPEALAEPSQQLNCITLKVNLDRSSYSGLMGLFNNAELLAFYRNGATLHPETAEFLLSCVEATARTFGDTLTALHSTYAMCHDSREIITPFMLAEFGATVGELLPFLVELASGLASDKTPPNFPISDNPTP